MSQTPRPQWAVAPRAGKPPDLQVLVDSSLADLRVRHEKWADALRQDAVESVARLSRWHLLRRGCRVPVYDLYIVAMKRAVDLLTRRFVEQAAGPTALYLGLSPAELTLAGQGCIQPLEIPASEADLLIQRPALEKELDFRIRFERTVMEHIEGLFERRVRPHLADTVQRITSTWARRVEE